MTEHVTGRTQAGAPDVDVSVVLPTFNERDNICDLAEAIRRELTPTGCRYEILVVDDSSPDGTADVVRAHFGTVRDPRGEAAPLDDGAGCVRLFVRTQDKGLAKSIRAGLEWAQGRTLVLVTHKPSMLSLVGRIIVVDGGKVVMDGPRDEVLRALSRPAGVQVPA